MSLDVKQPECNSLMHLLSYWFSSVLRAVGSYSMGNCTHSTDILKAKEARTLKLQCFGFNLQEEEKHTSLHDQQSCQQGTPAS